MNTLKKNDKIVIVNTNDIWENKTGIIQKISDDTLLDINGEEINNVTVKVLFDPERNKTIIQNFPSNCLELYSVENLETTLIEEFNLDFDYIKDYVYADSIENNIAPSWFFVSKIAAAENIKNDEVIRAAKKFNYKIYAIIANGFYKTVIAAPECSDKMIYNDYADYLDGTVIIKEI